MLCIVAQLASANSGITRFIIARYAFECCGLSTQMMSVIVYDSELIVRGECGVRGPVDVRVGARSRAGERTEIYVFCIH